MIYLVFAIIFSSLFSIVFKICQEKRIDNGLVILFNYVTALVFSLAPLIFNLAAGRETPDLSELALSATSWGRAIVQGLFFMLGFIVMDRSVWRSGVALTTVAARSSLVVSILLSWLFLGQDEPSWFPVLLMLAAIAMIILPTQTIQHTNVQLTSKTDKQRSRRAVLLLFGVCAIYGCSDFSLKTAQLSAPGNLSILEAAIFFTACLFTLAYCLVRKSFKHFNKGCLIGGIALGIVNTLCTFCCLRALETTSTSLYYPIYNIGIVVISTLAGVLIFKERLKWIQVVGLLAAGVAIVFMFTL